MPREEGQEVKGASRYAAAEEGGGNEGQDSLWCFVLAGV